MTHNITDLGGDLRHMVNLDLLTKDSVIVDAGASNGKFIKVMRDFTDCLIVALEPSRDNFSHLKFLDRVESYNVALVPEAYEKDKISFTQYKEKTRDRYLEWGSVTEIHEKEIEKRSSSEEIEVLKYDVPVLKISDLIKRFKVIDYLKLDIEGSEMEILLEFGPTVAGCIRQISVEYHFPDVITMAHHLDNLGYSTKVKIDEIYATRP